MPIRPSAGAEIRRLIDALSEDDVRREAAIARLAVIGPRATEHLLQEYGSAPPRVKAAMLRALEVVADPRALPIARTALDDTDENVAIAAIGMLRGLLADRHVSRDALDALVARALDNHQAPAIRLAAVDALRDAPVDIQTPVFATLSADPDPAISARTRTTAAPASATETTWREIVEGRLGASPSVVRAALATHRTSAGLTELQRLIDRLRTREREESDESTREAWRAVRGTVHQALAARGSRLALYDLRDSLLGSERLPVAFLAAIEEVGDASCLEPLAATYEESSRSGDIWWREHVAAAFRAIVLREGITRRHAVMKRLMSRSPEAAAELLGR